MIVRSTRYFVLIILYGTRQKFANQYFEAMNLALLGAFELHNELPEVIEDKISVGDSQVCVCGFNRRGNLLACGCKDGCVVVCDFDTHGVARTLKGHTRRVTAVSWTRSSRRLLSSSEDGRLMQWNVLEGTMLTAIDMGSEVAFSAMHPRKNRMCLACVSMANNSYQTYLQLWEPERREPLLSRDAALDDDVQASSVASSSTKKGDSALSVAPACFDKEGDRVLIGTNNGVVYVVSTESREVITSIQVPTLD